MTNILDLSDIQGNILQAYGRQGFPAGRCILLNVNRQRAQQARAVLDQLRRQVTTAELWESSRTRNLKGHYKVTVAKPDVALNLAFTFNGLLALGVPVRTLRGMPEEFQEGMLKRAAILRDAKGDVQRIHETVRQTWDPIWTRELEADATSAQVHVLVLLNGNSQPRQYGSTLEALEAKTRELFALCTQENGLTVLKGHRGGHDSYQDISILADPVKEHFGFTDGIGDPVFEGQYPDDTVTARKVIGQGKLTAQQTWEPLATGEFLLGYADEAQETPGSAMPLAFSRNGTFMAYRKLHQNVETFHRYIDGKAAIYAAMHGISHEEANETLRAKMAGRWSDGIPLIKAPTYTEWRQLQARFPTLSESEKAKLLTDFTYAGDTDGSRCPFSSHLRRTNPRDMLDPMAPVIKPGQSPQTTSVLNNRRRVLRRGLPYGQSGPGYSDADEHGVLMLVICSSLFRQFEFIQQQWLQYGLDFQSGNDTCPILGNHDQQSKFVIEASADSGKPPFICDAMPQFVEMRGGAYFFIPSMSSLRLITQGITDPT